VPFVFLFEAVPFVCLFEPLPFLFLFHLLPLLVAFLFLFPLLCVATLHYRDRGAEARGIKIRIAEARVKNNKQKGIQIRRAPFCICKSKWARVK
jgi:hypothetical protein